MIRTVINILLGGAQPVILYSVYVYVYEHYSLGSSGNQYHDAGKM